MPAADTDLTAARVQRAVFASKTGDERTAMAFEMSELMFQVTVDGIRRRFPEIDDAEVVMRLIERLHGPEVARAVARRTRCPVDTELLRRVVAALDDAGIAHMVTGSFASTLHGEPRATRDIDVVIDPGGGSLGALVGALPTDRFYVGAVAAALAGHDMFNIIDTRSGWKVGLIVRRDRPFSRAEFDRRQPATIAGVATFVTTVEDAILSKLEWHSITPSDLQRRDVVAMMIANAERLDRPYLHHWADALGVRPLLDELWESAVAER